MANQNTVINQMRGQNMVLEREIMKIRQLLNSFERRIADLEIDISSVMAPALDGPLHDEIVAEIEREAPIEMKAAVGDESPGLSVVPESKPRYEVRRTFQGFAVFEGMTQIGEKGSRESCEAIIRQLEAQERS